jgi:hypothetical protein
MSTLSRPAALAALVVVLAACAGSAASGGPSGSSGASAAPSSGPSAAPRSTPSTVGAIEHKTGPTDVILRFDEGGGGFMMPAWTAAQAPAFTLYGDGTLIFRPVKGDPLPAVGSTMPFHPFRTAKMSEDQIQTLLDHALNEGGLGAARAEYTDMMVSDASTAVFTVNAGGLAKTVSVYALGFEAPEVPDLAIRQVLASLRDHLLDIDQGGKVKTDVYAPDRYRAILLEGQPGAPDQKAWPWPEVKPAEFVSNSDPNAMPLPARVMTVAEIEALGITPFEGGFTGLPLAGPGDGKFYTLSVRPLLPDDKS